MDVALALFRWFPHGGMQRDLVATARALLARGHRVRAFAHTWDGPRPDGVDVQVLPARGRSNHVRAARFADALGAALQQHPADVVLGFDKMPGLDLYFAADPCFVARTAGRPWPYRLTPRYRAFRRLEGAVFGSRSAARILLLDERTGAAYRDRWGTLAGRFEVLPPGIARDRRRGPDAAALRAEGRRELALADDDLLLLMLASNPALKGLDRALRAVAALPPPLRDRARVVLAGRADPPAALARLARDLGVADRLRTLPGRDDVPRLLQAADVLVHPARRDTTGTVLLEAIAAGLPVLCTDACGYAAHVRRAGCGVVLDEPFAQAACDAALRELLNRDRAPLREAAERYAADTDLHGMHDAIVAAVEAAGARRTSERSHAP